MLVAALLVAGVAAALWRGSSLPRSEFAGVAVASEGLRFRVVDAQGSAVARARVVLLQEGPEGSRSSVIRGSADSDGVFEVVEFHLPGARAVLATVGLPDGGASREHRLTAPTSLQGPWDLGDLAIQPQKHVVVDVRERAGPPIRGAVIRCTERERSPIRTDAAGRAECAVAGQTYWLEISAAGFETRWIPIPSEWRPGPELRSLPVELVRNCRLTLQVSPPPSESSRVEVELAYAETPEPDAYFRRTWPVGGPSEVVALDAAGKAVFDTCPPGAPLRAVALSLGSAIGSRSIAPLSAGEHRVETLEVTVAPFALPIRVLAPNGDSVADATVELLAAGSERMGRVARADAQGLATFEMCFPATLDVEVRATGLATKSMHAVALAEAGLQVQLEPERVVDVELIRPDGTLIPVRGADSAVEALFPSGRSVVAEPGTLWRLAELPAGPVVICASCGSERASVLHDTRIPRVRIVVGARGRAQAILRLDDADATDVWAVTARPVIGDLPTTRVYVPRQRSRVERVRAVWFDGLAPGRYAFQLERWSSEAPWQFEARGAASTVDVGDTEEEVVVTLGP